MGASFFRRLASKGPRGRNLLALVVTAALACLQTAAQTPVTDWKPVFSSFYGGIPDDMDPKEPSYGTSVGSCGYGLLNKTEWPYWTVGALSTSSPFYLEGPLKGCGMCFEVQCMENGLLGSQPGSCQQSSNNRSIVMMVTDSCPECTQNHIDLQALTWAKIAKPSPTGGRINARMRRVECVPPSDLVLKVDSNRGDKGWIRLTVQKVGGPAQLKSVQVSGANSTIFEDLNNKWGAAWETGSSPASPMDVRMMATNGAKVTQPEAIFFNRQLGDISTAVQFNITEAADIQPSGKILDPSQVTPLPPEDDATPMAILSPADAAAEGVSSRTSPGKPSTIDTLSPPDGASNGASGSTSSAACSTYAWSQTLAWAAAIIGMWALATAGS